MPTPETKAPIKTQVLAYLTANPGADRVAIRENLGITRTQLDPVLAIGRKKGILSEQNGNWWYHPEGNAQPAHPASPTVRSNGRPRRFLAPDAGCEVTAPPPAAAVSAFALERAIAALEIRREALAETIELLRRMQQ